MKFDYSALSAFRLCPDLYRERYVKKLAPDWALLAPGKPSRTDFGTRIHQLLEQHYKRLAGLPVPEYPPCLDEPTELEAQKTFAEYLGHYPVEPFRVLAVETVFEVNVGEHIYTGKLDLVAQDDFAIFGVDHKTEGRSSKANTPEARASSAQFSLYQFALSRIYGADLGSFVLNRVTRASPKGEKPPLFFRDTLDRSPEQIDEAVRDALETVRIIEDYLERFGPDQPWPRNRDACVNPAYGTLCAFYNPHLFGWNDELLKLYKPADEYLKE